MRFGYEAITWQVASENYVGRIDHISRVLSQCGFEGIEPEVCMLGDYAEKPAELKELLESSNVSLAAICYVESWRQTRETDDEAVRAARVIEYVSHFPGTILQLCPASGQDRSDLRERQANSIRCMNDVARRAADRGIACVVHPNFSEGSVFRTRDDYDVLVGGLDASSVGLVAECGNLAYCGIDPLEIIRAYRPLVKHVHIKDLSPSGEWLGLGEGVLDVQGIVAYLTETDYQGWVIVEDISESALRGPDEACKRNAVYVHGVIGNRIAR